MVLWDDDDDDGVDGKKECMFISCEMNSLRRKKPHNTQQAEEISLDIRVMMI